MFFMDCIFCFIMLFMVVSAVILSVTVVSYYGVVSLMGFVFFCCVLMSFMGRTFVALIMYIVYLGGLIVVFGYCISVEKDPGDILKMSDSKFYVYLSVCLGVVVYLCVLVMLGVGSWLTVFSQDCFVCVEVNGVSVLYSSGGSGLLVCSWGLLVVLFSVLVVLGWHRYGGLRSF